MGDRDDALPPPAIVFRTRIFWDEWCLGDCSLEISVVSSSFFLLLLLGLWRGRGNASQVQRLACLAWAQETSKPYQIQEGKKKENRGSHERKRNTEEFDYYVARFRIPDTWAYEHVQVDRPC